MRLGLFSFDIVDITPLEFDKLQKLCTADNELSLHIEALQYRADISLCEVYVKRVGNVYRAALLIKEAGLIND